MALRIPAMPGDCQNRAGLSGGCSGGTDPLGPLLATGALPGVWRRAGNWEDGARVCAHAQGEELEVKCLKVRSLFSMNLLYLILSTNSNLIASGLKPLQ